MADLTNSSDKRNIDILIGSDFYWSFFTIRGPPSTPVALETKLGFVLSGPLLMSSHEVSTNLITTHALKIQTEHITLDELSNNLLHQFWENEAINDFDDNGISFSCFKKNLLFAEGKYQVWLPFNENLAHMESNS